MIQKIWSVFVIATIVFSQTSFALAQTLDAPAPTAESSAAMETTTAPMEKMAAPEADTVPPGFISIATASAEETEANIVWTTDEPAYGYVEYGETTSYGLSTPKSTAAAMDHMASIANLTPGIVYHYRIVAEDESGNIAYSEDRILETATEVVAVDNVPPEISQVSVSSVTTSGANISWITDELAQGKIEYGKTPEYGSVTSLASDYATEHTVTLVGLEANTEYHYRVVVQDESGNEASTPDEILTTDEIAPVTEPAPESEPESPASSTTTPETIPSASSGQTASTTTTVPAPSNTASSSTTVSSTPVSNTTAPSTPFTISHIETAIVGTSTATIIWNTSKAATSQVFYGLGETYASATPVIATSVTSHEVQLGGLKPGTNYFYKVVSRNTSGQIIEKSGFEFNTLYQEKKFVAAPVISNISLSAIGTTTATIIWTTNIPAGGEVKYGTTTAYGTSDGGHTHLLTSHTHPLSRLAPGTRYNFLAIARDTYGNQTIYENRTFTTLGGAPVMASPSQFEEPITDTTTITPVRSGGSVYSYTPTPTLVAPKLTRVEALDGQVMFIWNKKTATATLGSTKLATNIVIVKNQIAHPFNPSLGKIVYQGNSGLFTDTNVENGKIYYYSVFTVNQFNSYSRPTRFKVVPTKADEEVALEVIPPAVQRTPIYTFSRELSRGDQNKQVEHLQVLLASEPSIYSKGLITGYFGPLTQAAVKTFQKRRKLPVTGAADTATLKKLEKLSSIEVTKDRASVFDAALHRDLTSGMSGGDVSIMQQFLINIGSYPEALVTGYFGGLTRSAVQRFQQEQNISPASGYFGPVTKKRMLNLIRLRSISF